MARGIGVTNSAGVTQISAGVWQAVVVWEPGWPTIKTSAACLALTREVSSSPLLKLSFETTFPATNQ